MASIINAATSGGLVTSADTSGVLQLQTASTTAVTVDASQNVGIGTSSPAQKLAISNADTDRTAINLVNTSSGGGNFNIGAVGSAGWLGGSAGSLLIRDSNAGVTRVILDSSGTLQTYSTISVGNVTPSSSGAGITFPATQSGSSNANTLDDYEEGTWTAGFATWTTAPGTFVGSYTKIGRQVTLNMVGFGGVCNAGSTITGTPFTASTAGPASMICTTGANAIGFTAVLFDSGTQITNTSAASMTGQYWTCSFTYQTN